MKDYGLKSIQMSWDGAFKIVADPQKSSDQYQEKALELLNQKTKAVSDEDILFNPFAGLEDK